MFITVEAFFIDNKEMEFISERGELVLSFKKNDMFIFFSPS